MTTKVVNIHACPTGWEKDPSYVYIGRTGHGHDGYFGNEFPLKKGATDLERSICIGHFKSLFRERVIYDEPYRQRVLSLKDKKLVCFCKPKECHGDVYVKWIEEQTTPEQKEEEMKMEPKDDGITHINCYSKGNTELGRFLSNFAHTPFDCEDGHFESVEGYWYWLGLSPASHRDDLRSLWGFEAKSRGRSLRGEDYPNVPNFREKILKAVFSKIEANPEMKRVVLSSTLPLVHYYVYGGAIKKDERSDWLWHEIQSWRDHNREEPVENTKFAIALTGHRPIKLGGYGRSETQDWVRKELRAILLRCIEKYGAPNVIVISGMALGADQWWAEEALNLNLTVHAYIPFTGQEGRWPQVSQQTYSNILSRCAVVKNCMEERWNRFYDDMNSIREYMQYRNECMIRDCKALVAVYDGSHGGTKNCYDVAHHNMPRFIKDQNLLRWIWVIDPRSRECKWDKPTP
jgi:uncharacterized phage-like protein YoqJ/predicted NAD-dependent protein-ADP-ribosyltransferase YbiA (DUF1768 family)